MWMLSGPPRDPPRCACPQVTAAKIRELARGKDAAVAREDYDEAKRIKAGIDRLKVSYKGSVAQRMSYISVP